MLYIILPIYLIRFLLIRIFISFLFFYADMRQNRERANNDSVVMGKVGANTVRKNISNNKNNNVNNNYHEQRSEVQRNKSAQSRSSTSASAVSMALHSKSSENQMVAGICLILIFIYGFSNT
jgi:hypothetical protein